MKDALASENAKFKGNAQQDTCEAIRFILNAADQDLNRLKSKDNEQENTSFELVDKDAVESLEDDKVIDYYRQVALSKSQSVISELFYSQLKTTSECIKCGRTQRGIESLSCVPIQLPMEGMIQSGGGKKKGKNKGAANRRILSFEEELDKSNKLEERVRADANSSFWCSKCNEFGDFKKTKEY